MALIPHPAAADDPLKEVRDQHDGGDPTQPAAHVDALRVLADHARVVAGDAAIITLSRTDGVDLHVLKIVPTRRAARPISITAGQWLVVSVGHAGGRWELDYTDHDLSFARDVVTAVIDGRISERTAFARSAVTITLPDGAMHTQVGYDGCLGGLVPQPGWRTHGTLIRPEPYR